jgi:hydrogenase maturation protease
VTAPLRPPPRGSAAFAAALGAGEAEGRGPASTLVLAYGNPLRGDDGAGPAAVAGVDLGGCQVIVAHQLLPEHAERVARAARVVFVDAREGGSPGEVREETVAAGGDAPLSHHLAPGHLLGLARALGEAAPQAIALSVTGADFDLGERLSPAVEAALPLLRARLQRVLSAP